MLKNGETNTEVSSVSILREAYPQRVSLTLAEVAWTLFGSNARSEILKVRRILLCRQLVPNLSKVGGRWLIPLVSLGRALDALEQVPVGKPPVWDWPLPRLPTPAAGRRRWRAEIGARTGDR